ncbi:hypothetical protein CYR40_20150 [Chimaeribacter arupi]|uniref:Type II toxin-antitoxin system Phd/YefM family antitoxin n=1 Tax=Nissabacter archeti TaxID=1917880 RepID=A0ABS5JCL0_9GAMM|nr:MULTISPECIES: type II toxin-antitoxin system Phd/YefM family antitoxin [Yersiniaceae]MBS0967576.1 type II toxin-antitoxin system Phd/YefM family antitoxin [Nissabacter archeti]MDV5140961.1 type II toxin-antitoxin system Phd/YefM family antitoxin [Chimaeribacter arupi]PLR29233.1 hypothetical protein CYR23_21080 [Chimaeribacter arupi]PLR42549.1 hypothetical protein CYR40_20150 [Chimaeribacter arupi]PLR47477.1 hypothetical protein CYR52_14565 [Chimaeribacter arupi]
MGATAIFANHVASITELKKNPSATVASAEGQPVAIMNHSKTAFYCVPAPLFEMMMDIIDERELAKRVRDRLHEEEIEVNWEDL